MTPFISAKQIRRWRQKVTMRLYGASKQLVHWVRSPLAAPAQGQRVLFIIGCQRSGTTLMTRLFNRDFNARVYPEHSALSNQDKLDGLRLNPLPQVKQAIEATRFPLIVLKPLVETQNSRQLLDFFPNSQALWLYRDYSDVALSNLRRFGSNNGIKNLRYIAQRQEDNWRVENLDPEYRALVDRYFSEEMNPHDAAALFWLMRNSFFFTLDLAQHPQVMMLRYSDLVTQPTARMTAVYNFIQQPFPGSRLVQEVHQTSLGKGQARIELSPDIQALCDAMLARLDASYASQQQARQTERPS